MTPLTEQYFILLRDYATVDDRPLYAGAEAANDDTSDRLFDPDPIRLGIPMRFRMDMFDMRVADNLPGEIGHFIITGPVVLVSEAVRNVMVEYQNASFELYPAILETIDRTYVEPLYFLHMMRHLDVWDREKSTYLIPFDPDVDLGASLTQIVLNDAELGLTPEAQRMIISLDRLDQLPVLLHEKLVAELLEKKLTSGARLFRLSEYIQGQEMF
ncbi:imm11 family protein [Paracoccus sulfuroxidans]|uniref:Immunity MXAN-0049 protein domain-containing protein n=1 Tax=Paracoccus sulfuroxidans TaxID=384678 RepID=A0A562NB09_9RHOB|nr:DUF1629 domain-containing protein [Paracoccus sulfuroxidans]TWI29290.1 hypothetical protein IQ24_03770 [Paracoccus sulfuroxidans]